MAKATLKQTAPTTIKQPSTRSPSFYIDDDIFTTIWAKHNKKWTDKEDASMDYEGQYDLFVSFCFQVFCAVTDKKEAEKCGCKDAKINDVNLFKNKMPKLWADDGIPNDLFERKEIIYDFMKDRCIRKAEDLFPQICEFAEGIELPLGMVWANWMTSDRRKAKAYALKFM